MKYAPSIARPVFVTWDKPFNPAHARNAHPAITAMVRPVIDGDDTRTDIVAKIMAEAAAVGVDNTPDVWCFHWQNITSGQFSGIGPLDAGLDELLLPAPYAPTPPECSMFCANGVNATRGRIESVLQDLVPTWEGEGYATPAQCCHDDESVIGFGGTPAPIVGSQAPPALQGVWVPSLADERAAVEEVFPGYTLYQVEQARIAAGVPYANTENMFSTTNVAFLSWLAQYGRHDWLMERCLYQTLRELWSASIKTSNYYDCAASVANPIRDQFNANSLQVASTLYADCHAPVMYPPSMTHPSHTARMLPGESQSAYFRRFCKENRDAIAAGPLPTRPCTPWLVVPGQSVAPMSTYVATVADVVDIACYCWARYGDTRFLLWSSAASTTVDDAILQVTEGVYTYVLANYRPRSRIFMEQI